MQNEEKIINMLDILTKDVSGLKQDVGSLKQGQARLEKKIETEIESLATSTKNSFEELDQKFEKRFDGVEQDISSIKKGQEKLSLSFIALDSKVEQSLGKTKTYKSEITGATEKAMYELEDLRKSQIINIDTHDSIKDNHEKLEEKVCSHDVRIKALELSRP